METKAHHLLIGIFTLAFLVGAFIFAVWLVDSELNRSYDTYFVDFQGSVSGLTDAADVSYLGLKVGQVSSLKLHPRDPTRIRVKIQVRPNTPVSEDTVAVLEQQGFTGVAFLELKGGGHDSPPLKKAPGEEYPVIRSELSAFQSVFAGAPDLINAGLRLAAEIQKVFDVENQQAFKNILRNVDTVTAQLAASEDNIVETFANLQEISENTLGATRAVQDLAVRLHSIADEDLTPFIKRANSAAETIDGAATSYGKLADSLDLMVSENRSAIRTFTREGLPEFTRLAIQGRQLARSLGAVAEQLRSDPARFLFGTQQTEYEARQ